LRVEPRRVQRHRQGKIAARQDVREPIERAALVAARQRGGHGGLEIEGQSEVGRDHRPTDHPASCIRSTDVERARQVGADGVGEASPRSLPVRPTERDARHAHPVRDGRRVAVRDQGGGARDAHGHEARGGQAAAPQQCPPR
jgi:hypothetical protein